MLRTIRPECWVFLLAYIFLPFISTPAHGQSAQSQHELQPHMLTAPEPAEHLAWGHNIALEGDTLFVAATDFESEEDEPDGGQIWKLIHTDDNWQYNKVLESPAADGARFGYSLAVADSIMIVGAPEDENADGLRTGAAYVYYLDQEDGWELRHRFQPDLLEEGARFGHSVAADSGRVLVSAVEQPRYDLERVGRVFGYDLIRNPDEDPIRSDLNVSMSSERERLGWALDIRGKWAVVTTQEAGLVIGPRNRSFLFEQSTVNTGWTARETFNRSQSNWVHFGEDAAISEHTAFVGHPREHYDDAENGVVYLYEGFRTEDPFQNTGFIPPSAPQSFSNYGRGVSTHGDEVVIAGTFVVDHLRRTGDDTNGYSWEIVGSFPSDGGDTRRFSGPVDINDHFMVATGFDGPDQSTANRVIYWHPTSQPTHAETEPADTPALARLHPAYPNPFNPETIIPFSLQEPAHTRLEVYDATGRKVAVLLDEALAPGEHTVRFNARDLASGVYVYRLTVGGQVFGRPMTLIK